jgi:hypothetical protein
MQSSDEKDATLGNVTLKGEACSFREGGESDFPRIASFFSKHKYRLGSERYLRKKYLENPAGRGRIFLMEDSEKEIQGTLGYVPHAILARKGPPVSVMESVDLFFAPEARGKRMFPRIQGSAMQCVEGPLIAFPNKRSEEITVRLGWKRTALIRNWYFPIGSGWASGNPVGRLLLKVLGGLCRLHACLWLWSGRVDAIRLQAVKSFEQDFSGSMHGPWVGRSPDFLHWRFLDDPVRQFQFFELRQGDDVIGSCVLDEEEDSTVIYDFFAEKHSRSCLRQVVRHCRRKGMNWLVFRGVGLKLLRFGFIRWLSKTSLISHRLPERSWVLTLADSDW